MSLLRLWLGMEPSVAVRVRSNSTDAEIDLNSSGKENPGRCLKTAILSCTSSAPRLVGPDSL